VKKEENNIDFTVLFYKVLSYWPFFILSIGLCFTIAKVYLHYTIPIFKANTTIFINDTKAVGLEEMSLFSQSKSIGNEMAFIQSYDMVDKTIRKLDFDVSYFHTGEVNNLELYHNYLFEVKLDSGEQLYETPIFIDFITATTFKLRIGENELVDNIFFINQSIHQNNFNFSISADSR
jgi:hypothetical protein